MLVNISHETYSFPSDRQKATKKRKVQERAKTYMQGLSACSASPSFYLCYFRTEFSVLNESRQKYLLLLYALASAL